MALTQAEEFGTIALLLRRLSSTDYTGFCNGMDCADIIQCSRLQCAKRAGFLRQNGRGAVPGDRTRVRLR